MSSETKDGMFSDLEELSHTEVKQLVKDADIQVRSLEQEHQDIRDERKNQITLVKINAPSSWRYWKREIWSGRNCFNDFILQGNL